MFNTSIFLREFLKDQFPPETGPWIKFDGHDPPWTRHQLVRMAKAGIIELDEPRERYRLTMKAVTVAAKKGIVPPC